MHIAFIIERCPQYGKVSNHYPMPRCPYYAEVFEIKRRPKYVDSFNVCH